MAGIYIHIPFCHKRCNYCNFHTSTCLNLKDEVIESIVKEIELQKNYLGQEIIETIYFGGGTPSILKSSEIEKILNATKNNFNISENAEITIEANPIDLIEEKICDFKKIGINRLSIGIQTFNEKFLKILNRQDSLSNIYKCIANIHKYNFKNFNLDLIFGILGQNKKELEEDLKHLLAIRPTHISAYCLTIEPKTIFEFYLKTDKIKTLDDDLLAVFFLFIDNILTKNGYEHYEISNYCLPGFKSVHNSNYWQNKKYLGVGPSAHSYNIKSRQWNIENNALYVKSIKNNKIPMNVEILSKNDKVNEYIFTHLRTIDGCDLEYLKDNFNYYADKNLIEKLCKQGFMCRKNNFIKLTPRGMLLSNDIISKLFLD